MPDLSDFKKKIYSSRAAKESSRKDIGMSQSLLRSFFAGLIENIFASEMGVCNPQVSRYFTNLLTSYIHVDDLFPFKKNGRIISLATLISREQKANHKKYYRYAGDFTIFWAGLYPENIKNLHSTGMGFGKKEFIRSGKKCYQAAAELTNKYEIPHQELLCYLSERFEECAYGLSLCKKEFK